MNVVLSTIYSLSINQQWRFYVVAGGTGHPNVDQAPKYLGNLFIEREKKIKLNGPKSGITTAITLASYHKRVAQVSYIYFKY